MNTTTTLDVTGIDTYFVLVKDMERAIAFYRDVVGLNVTRREETWMEFELPDGTAYNLAILPGGAWHRTGGALFAVRDIHETERKLREANVTFLTPLIDTPSCYSIWCEDSEGNAFGVHQKK